MSAPTAAQSGRRAAERLMLDAGTAKRPTGGKVPDPVNQTEVDATVDLFASRCKVQSNALVDDQMEVGGRTATRLQVTLHLPADTDPLQVGDLFTVTTPHPLSAVPAGRTYRVLAPFDKSLATSRRYNVEVVL